MEEKRYCICFVNTLDDDFGYACGECVDDRYGYDLTYNQAKSIVKHLNKKGPDFISYSFQEVEDVVDECRYIHAF